MAIECIDRLGAEVESSWRAVDYALPAFPEIAERLLRDADLPSQISADDIAGWALRAPALPSQADPTAKFGQPPITLFRGARFYIDALFWIDGTTSIHQHGFSGAFQVLSGSSIESLFSFAVERAFDGHFLLGTLQVSSGGLLHQGDVRPILSGARLIHSVFHLDRPSISIVVRTVGDPGGTPQFSYLRAGIGRNPFFAEETMERRLQVVSMLRKVKHGSFERLVGDLIADTDLHTAYRIIVESANHGSVDSLIERVRDRAAADRFRVAIKDLRRESLLTGRRSVVTDPDMRFFLGVLLNATRQRDVLAITRQKQPDVRPAEQVATWLRRLSTVNAKLQVDGVPWQPNLLGLPEFDDRLERACVDYLAGRSPDALDDVTARAFAQLRALPALNCLFES
jgi:hypothetical protein